MADEETPRAPAEWPHLYLLAGWLLVVVLQLTLFPCLCPDGEAQVKAGLVLDALVLARLLLARFLHEKGRRWVLYAIVLATSLLWIPAFVGPHGKALSETGREAPVPRSLSNRSGRRASDAGFLQRPVGLPMRTRAAVPLRRVRQLNT